MSAHVRLSHTEDVPLVSAAILTASSSGSSIELSRDGDVIEVLEPEDVLGIGLGSDVLVVDDDPTNLVAYEAALAPLGRTLVLAQSGKQALAKLLEQDFALILLDMSMPDISGLETARLIRQRPRCKSTPIIFITGMAWSNEVILEAYAAGAFDFVIKPVLPEILRAKAGVYLALQERTQKVLRQAAQLRDAHERLVVAHQRDRDRDATAATARRLAKLQEATAGLAEAMTPADVARVAVRLGAEAVDASAATMWSAQPDGSLVLDASHGVPSSYLDEWRVVRPDARLPVVRVLAQSQPIWVENEADFAREAPDALDRARAVNRVWAFAALPLTSGGRVIAVISFNYQGQHTFTEEERTFLRALVHTCEQALERARLYSAESEARKTAEQLSQRKDEFLAMLGHELRNPLAVMLSALELIKARDLTMSRELSLLDRQVAHLVNIVGNLVNVSRITQGKISIEPGTTDLAAVVAQVIEAARTEIDLRRHDVVVDIPEATLLHADAERLDQTLANLVSNAIKYTQDGGRIELSASADESHVQIVVRDNGQGISNTLLPNVFDLFVQGERALDRREGGLGIGLTLVRTIVELHGGTAQAHSDGPGTGSTFTIRWPKATATSKKADATRLSTATSSPPGLKVLIVDDNVEAVEFLAELVNHFGHQTAVAHDGEAALAIAQNFAPDVALLDIGLPNMDGYELARRLRLLPSWANTMLVAVTGYGQSDDHLRSKEAGFAHHVVKPLDANTLKRLLSDDLDPALLES